MREERATDESDTCGVRSHWSALCILNTFFNSKKNDIFQGEEDFNVYQILNY